MSQTHNIRWLISHEPVDLFLRTAEEFSRDIAKRTNGRINIEVYTLTDYANKFKDGVKSDPMALLQNKEIEMTQVQMYKLGTYSTDFFALEMPFLFESHSHATRVLEGDIGKSILASLKTTSPATGLAFTYSGGYRVIAADKDIRTTEDLKGLEIATTTNPVEIATIESFGCKAVPVHTGDWTAETVAVRHNSQAVDTTLPRYKNEANVAVHKHVIDTKHSMFLTSIIISTDFWNSLSQEDQEAIQASALHSSRLERQWSIDDADAISDNVEHQRELGITLNGFDLAEQARLKEAVKPVYEQYSQFFTAGLVDGIIKG